MKEELTREEKAQLSFFKDRRNEVHILYDIFCEALHEQAEKYFPHKIPERFTLIAAIATIIPDLRAVNGYVTIFSMIDPATRMGHPVACPHQWLVWRNPHFIIDVIPLDGKVGISVPQAVIEEKRFQRFFPGDKLYPVNWSERNRIEFDQEVSELADILLPLYKKVPC